MTAGVVIERGADAALPAEPAVLSRPRWRPRAPRWAVFSVGLSTLNAIAFLILRPGVNDLWAARARASAVANGVGLTYWFSWFGGGSTPGNYSVITPSLSALLSAELVGALSAVACVALAAVAVRGTRYPAAATAVATVAAAANLWSGRVPFLLGTAFAVAAIVAVQHRQAVGAGAAAALSILASPVSGAFLALGLAGSLLVQRRYRTVSAITIATVVVFLGLVGLAFGAPGAQHFSLFLCVEALAALTLLLLAQPPDHIRVVLWLSMLTTLVLWLVPNGMGSNFGRMLWFCLPVAVVATAGRRVVVALALAVPVLITGAQQTLVDLAQAGQPVADTSYYQPLAHQLDEISGLDNYRVEVVSQGAHAAYDALLNHAMLARGWETQEDNHLNAVLQSPKLDATSYKVWLDNNSVGYVAFPQSKIEQYPEYLLVWSGLDYLHLVWRSADWTLFQVGNPTPIVAAPQSVTTYQQARLTIRSACACTFTVRIRYSRYLRARPLSGHTGTATVSADPYGFTSMTVSTPGDYSVYGTARLLFG